MSADTLRDLLMSREEVGAMIEIEPILAKLGLSLFCLRCHAAGRADGVKAANAPSDQEWIIECGCTLRRYRRES